MDDGLEHCGVAGELLTFAVPVLVSVRLPLSYSRALAVFTCPVLSQNAAHPSASVRQAAVYGIGVCAMKGDSGDEFSSVAADVVAPLQGAALSLVVRAACGHPRRTLVHGLRRATPTNTALPIVRTTRSVRCLSWRYSVAWSWDHTLPAPSLASYCNTCL